MPHLSPPEPAPDPGDTTGRDPRDTILQLAAGVLDRYFAVTATHPDISIRRVPRLGRLWRVAHCCQRIYVDPDQPYSVMLASLDEAMARLRARGPVAASPAPRHIHYDELAAQRDRRRSG